MPGGNPIEEPSNSNFFSKSNPAPKSSKKRKNGISSPFDHKNDRKKDRRKESYHKSPHFETINSQDKSLNTQSVQDSQSPVSGPSLLAAGLAKFKNEKNTFKEGKQISFAGKAALERFSASSGQQQPRPTTSRGRQEAPKLHFQQQNTDDSDVQMMGPSKSTIRAKMQPKPTIVTESESPEYTDSYLVELAWAQSVSSEEKFELPLPNDARLYFAKDHIYLNFREDSPFNSNDLRDIRYVEESAFIYILLVLKCGDKIWIYAVKSSGISAIFFNPIKLGHLSSEEQRQFELLLSKKHGKVLTRSSDHKNSETQNTLKLNTLKEKRGELKSSSKLEQTQVSNFYQRSTRSSSKPLFESSLYSIPTKRELRKRDQAPEPVNLIPMPATNNEIFKYPLRIDKFAISVREHDRHRMNEGEFLNDTAIEFYIRYLRNDMVYDTEWKAFNSYFYSQYTSDPKTGLNTDRGAFYNYEKVRKWTANEDIFKNEFIFVPINEHLHWYLGVIWNPGSLLIDKTESSLSQEYDIYPVKSSITSSIAKKYQDEVIHIEESDELRGSQEGGGPQEGGGSHGLGIKENPHCISDSDDGVDPITQTEVATQVAKKGKSKPLDSDFVVETGGNDSSESLTDAGSPAEFIPVKPRELRLKSKSASPDLGAKITDLRKKPTPITGTMKRNEKERREEKMRLIQEERLTRRKQKCAIIVIDSLGVKRVRPTRVLKNYLCEELLNRKGISLDPDSKLYFDCIPDPKTPIQPNHCDCGVYLLQALESIVKNPEKYRDYLLSGKNSPSEWFGHDEIVLKRRMIMSLMDKLEKEFSQMNLGEMSPTSSFETVEGTAMDVEKPDEAATQDAESDVVIID